MFDSVDPKQSFPALEHGILKYWREEDAFKRSMERRKGGPVFSFYDGPPFATGLPHYGHILAGTIKDVIPRYQTMRGYQVKRRFGWDCHGLPVENEIEKEQGLLTKKDIEAIGTRAFNALCRAAVGRYTKEWQITVERLGRWVDMDWDYRTMDPDYMESIWWVFRELHNRNLIYEGHKPMHVCPRCQTPLSNFEVTQGYKDISDYALTAMFALEEGTPAPEQSSVRGIADTEFRAPKNEREWQKLHDIRKTALFGRYHPEIAYDPAFSSDGKVLDDLRPDTHPFILLHGKDVIGTVRIEFLDAKRAAVRLFTIDEKYQKQGFGRILLQKAEQFIRGHGRTVVLLHAHDKAPDFYRKQGYVDTEPWDKKKNQLGLIDLKKELTSVTPANSVASATCFLAWTTTGWTLPGNLFLAVAKDTPYVTVESEGRKFILAKALAERVFKGREYKVLSECKGSALIGKKYRPLFPYFANAYKDKAFRVVDGSEFVTTEDGTGIVHIATGYGEDDHLVGKREKVDVLQHVGIDGKFIDAVKDFAGQDAKPKDDPTKGDKGIAKWLKDHGKLFKAESFTHSYPHCWRCESPLLNYATSSWFVAVEKIKGDMLSANAKTAWVPSGLRDGRFGKWLEGARDWAISRNRYWGTPLPIWRRTDTGDVHVLGSRDELMKLSPHRFTKVIIARHAESRGNVEGIYQGKEPGTPLTKDGKGQAKALGKLIGGSLKNGHGISMVYASPLQRTLETAQEISNATGAEIVIDNRLREIDFGEYEGKHIDFDNLAFAKQRRAHKLETGQIESVYHFPGMETWSHTEARCRALLDEVLPKHRGQTIVLVTHADLVMNFTHIFTKQDKHKIVHQPYPEVGQARTFYFDHLTGDQMDLHKETVDDIVWTAHEQPKVRGKKKESQSGTVTVVRHGQTEWNRDGKLQGSEHDTPLNEEGRKQAKKLATELKGKKFDAIITSTLKRAKETGEILGRELGVPVTGHWKEWNERGLGAWSGKLFAEVIRDYPNLIPVPIGSSTFHHLTPPKGESLNQLLARTEAGCMRLWEEYSGKNVLVVGHSGTFRAMHAVAARMHYVDVLRLAPKNTDTATFPLTPFYKRIPDVLDCWFESGSMPYAQEHFPFEHAGAKLPPGFPADFIAEGLDQTRGWFYTLMVLSAALYKQPAFLHCVVNGIVLAEDGKKMSKRLKNYPEPTVLTEKYGADAVRLALMSSPAVRGEDLRFSEKVVGESLRAVILPLWNVYRLFVTYANAADWKPSLDFALKNATSSHLLDTWIVARTQDLVNRMTGELDAYDLSATCSHLSAAMDDLTNWYVRLSRRRFAGKGEGESAQSQAQAFDTLYRVLITVSQLLAPFCPFVSEAIYLNLVGEEHGSIHFTDWPQTSELTDEQKRTITLMDSTRTVVRLGLHLRSEAKVGVRTPLPAVTFALPPSDSAGVVADLIREELNVKQVIAIKDAGALGQRTVQVDARKVGPRLGARVQDIIRAAKAGDFTEHADTIMVLGETLTGEEAKVVFSSKEGQKVASDHGIVVSLDTALSKELKLEGLARELIRAIQQLRKDAGLEFTDRIHLALDGADDILASHKDLILSETRSVLSENHGKEQKIDLEDMTITAKFEKA